jgi:hypothetical protein
MMILPEEIHKLNAFPIKIPIMLFTEIDKSVLKFIWMHKRA